MPKRHGLYRSADAEPRTPGYAPICRIGIWRVVDGLRGGPFRDTVRRTLTSPHLDVTQQFSLQFSDVRERLFASLDELQTSLEEYKHTDPGQSRERLLLARSICMATDSACLYLTQFVDCVAQLIDLTYHDQKNTLIPGFRTLLADRAAVPAVDDQTYAWLTNPAGPPAWWLERFERPMGVLSVGHSQPAEGEAATYVTLIVPGRNEHVPMIDTIRDFLYGFFNWLDILEDRLIQHLQRVASQRNVTWEPETSIPFHPIRLDYPDPPRVIPSIDFLYLPECSDTGEVGGSFGVTFGPTEGL